jgi:hypothetical protein
MATSELFDEEKLICYNWLTDTWGSKYIYLVVIYNFTNGD